MMTRDQIELLQEAASNCKASIAEEGISDSRRVYRTELHHHLEQAIAILTAALAEPEGEAVAWIIPMTQGKPMLTMDKGFADGARNVDEKDVVPLFTHPAPSKPAPLTELTDENRFDVLYAHGYERTQDNLDLFRAIEAAVWEKMNG